MSGNFKNVHRIIHHLILHLSVINVHNGNKKRHSYTRKRRSKYKYNRHLNYLIYRDPFILSNLSQRFPVRQLSTTQFRPSFCLLNDDATVSFGMFIILYFSSNTLNNTSQSIREHVQVIFNRFLYIFTNNDY